MLLGKASLLFMAKIENIIYPSGQAGHILLESYTVNRPSLGNHTFVQFVDQ